MKIFIFTTRTPYLVLIKFNAHDIKPILVVILVKQEIA